ncbi:hypothetical protein GUITHDRAFT_138995 [Guillardia theta CCMP2712]|uniref:Uncharacterized protein n=1 Tax=Guillardia theta (strain CCMP2712) TaxID=905079 RepID=L1JA56_GUITC|nr:hypothetical protein GUITHDRAFT_138995 [Guillardia theta CCMP2712]EKX45423.1 hypothetical protein GUITHDRAFT_138995 [Guillardia theta CCMP2712]|eukprot:XP_005832403.1 hypothetical protein GUITHDRAFT_138995 [Guillardia theta CCMP2712]
MLALLIPIDQIEFKDFFHFEYLLCPRRLLLLESDGQMSQVQRNELKRAIPGKVILSWPETCERVKNQDKSGAELKTYIETSLDDAVVDKRAFSEHLFTCKIISPSDWKASRNSNKRDELMKEFESTVALQQDLERSKKSKTVPDDKLINEGKISVRQYIEIIAKWRMSRNQYHEWPYKDRKEYGSSTIGEILQKLKAQFRKTYGLRTTSTFICSVSEDRWLMTRHPLQEVLIDLKCQEIKFEAEQELRASQALTFVPDIVLRFVMETALRAI